jgi:hypothetical protein
MALAHERAGKAPKTIITDKLRAYISGIEDEYGAEGAQESIFFFPIKKNSWDRSTKRIAL